MKYFFIFFSIATICQACVKNEREQIDIIGDKSFFPLQVGRFLEYEVDSIYYRQGTFLDSVHTQVREEILTQSKDSLGEVYIILRSNKKRPDQPWIPSSSYSARIIDQKAIRNEGNLHFIKLIFPFVLNQTWEGLALIQTDIKFDVQGETIEPYQNWEPFKIKDSSHAEKIGTFSFNEVVTVLQTDEEDILSKRFSVEKYAKNIGLVYKELSILDCNTNINGMPNSCNSLEPWRTRATKGFIMRQTLARHN